jgi:hypothetical protein
MNLPEIITRLRQIARTVPRNTTYDLNPDVASLLRSVKEKCLDKHDFSESDIEAIVAFSLDLLDIPADLTGVRIAEPCTRQVIEGIFLDVPKNAVTTTSEKADIFAIRDRFMAVIDAWYHVLRASGLNQLDLWPPIGESLPLSYNLTAFKESKIPYSKERKGQRKKKDEFPPAMYVAFGYFFHKKLRERIMQYRNPATVKNAEELARIPFEYASDWARKSTVHVPGDYGDDLKKDWLENYKKAGRNRSKVLSDSVEDKRLAFERFLSDKPGRSKSIRVRRIMSGSDEPGNDEAPDDVMLPRTREGRELSYRSSESTPYEPPIEVFLGLQNDSGEQKKTGAWRRDTLHSRFVPHPWELKPLQLHHYAFIYDVIHMETGRSREKNAITLFYRILMHTGIDPEMLLDLIAFGPESSEDTLDLKKIGDRYYLLNPAIVSLEGSQSPHCSPTAEKIHIPLPAEIGKQVPLTPADGSHIFSYHEENGSPRLTKDQVAKFWTTPDSSAGGSKKRKKKRYRNGITVTPKNIAYSFYSLYCGSFGLDPFIACHVSGTDHRLIYGPQLHYVHVSHERLDKDFLETFYKVDHYIRTVQHQYSLAGLIPNKMQKPVKYQKPIVAPTDFAGYGSSVVPDPGFLKDRMNALGDAISNEKDVFRRHNLYVSYTYLALQFATMLRPHDDPNLYWHHFIRRTGTISIADKDSRNHREVRVLRLPERVQTLLIRLQDGRKAFEGKRQDYCLSRQTTRAEKIFFSVKENGVLAPFSFATILSAFASLNLDFDVPHNMARHFTRTRMHENKISNSMAAAWAGHARTGREVASIASTTTLSELSRACLPCIDAMLDDLGIRELEYLP